MEDAKAKAADDVAAGTDSAKRQARKASLLQMMVSLCDRYGHTSLNDPRRQPQTIPGVLITGLFVSLTALLIGSTIMKISTSEEDIRFGGRAPLNGLYQTWVSGNSSDVNMQTWSNFYIPSLELKFEEKIIFFQRPGDRRPIYKVEVRDRNGYHKTFSSDTRPAPVGFAARSLHEVPINSFDERVNKAVVSPVSSIKFNLEDKLYFANVIKSLESLQIVRGNIHTEVRTRIYTLTHTHTHTNTACQLFQRALGVIDSALSATLHIYLCMIRAYVYICVHIYMYVYIYKYICTHKYSLRFSEESVFVYTYVQLCICVCVLA